MFSEGIDKQHRTVMGYVKRPILRNLGNFSEIKYKLCQFVL